jgi:glucose-1-phosphate thymidylyltransferase
LEASHFVHTIEQRQGLKVACLEEIAYVNGWITTEELRTQAHNLGKTGYGQYLHKLLASSQDPSSGSPSALI